METMTNNNPPENNLTEEQIREKARAAALRKLKESKVTVIDIDDLAEREARKAGDAHMTEEKGRASFFKKIWKHTFFDEYYRQKEINKVREEIKEKENIYAGRIPDSAKNTRGSIYSLNKGNLDKTNHAAAMHAVSERFISDYEGLVDPKDKKILDATDPESVKTKNELKKLITNYASGALNISAFNAEKVRILDGLKDQDLLKGAENYSDNLLEIATNARLAIEHGAKLEELDFDLDVIIGKAKSSLKTEAHFNTVDKAIDKLRKMPIFKVFSPAVISTSVGLAYSVSVGLGTKVFKSKAAAYFSLGGSVAVAGLMAGVNENQRLELEKKQHALEMAEGATFEPGSKRRELMEKYQYQAESSKELAENLRKLMFTKDANGKDVPKDFTEAEVSTILAQIGNIEARNALNDKKKIDLLSYSSIGSVEKESTDLAILTARAKVELKKKLESGFAGGIPQGETFKSYLEKQTEAIERSLLGGEAGIDATDKAFKNFKRKEVAKKVAFTVLSGLVIGAAVQEGVAFFKDDVQGFAEGLISGHHGVGTETPLEHLRSWITGNQSHLPLGHAVAHNLNGHNFKLPENTDIINNSDGTYDILKQGKHISSHIKLNFDSNGELDHASIARLGKDGIVAGSIHNSIIGPHNTTTSAEDYIKDHKPGTTKIARDGWYDNDTPKPIFDQNELQTHWGGVNGTGIDASGNHVLNMSRMASDGSFHGEFSVDAQDKIKNGGLKMILSLTQNTQSEVFEVPIDIHGNAVIDPHSEIGKLFFGTDAAGHSVFKGRFAEVVETFGTKNGTEHVKTLSTLVGPGNDTISNVVSAPADTVITKFDILNSNSNDMEPPYFIPFFSRNPLEKTENKEKDVEGIVPPQDGEVFPPMSYYFGNSFSGFESSEQKRAQYEKERSEALKENPDANLDQFTEIESYLKKQNPDHLVFIKGISDEMGSIGKDCRVSVCIPVAGHQEGANIYNTLQNYSEQTADKSKFELVLFVNRPGKNKKGEIVNPDETMNEIARFKKDYPEMNIKVAESILPIEKANIGYIRKAMNDAVLFRQIARGKDSPELLMVSNDADNSGLSTKYIDNFISKFDENKNVDSLVGQLDWDPKSFIRNPLIHIGTRLMLYQGAQSRNKGWGFNSSGANFAFRSSMYAAVGGYTEGMGGGEDTDFGEKIKEARKGANDKKPIAYAGPNSRLYTSSRRAEMVMKNHGLAPIEQWDKGFSAFDDEVRKVDWASLGEKVDYSNEEEIKKLVSALETVINRTIKRGEVWGGSTADLVLKRSLGWLGIKYEVTGPQSIKITDATKLIQGLEKYQTQGLEIVEKKTKLKKSETVIESKKPLAPPIEAAPIDPEAKEEKLRIPEKEAELKNPETQTEIERPVIFKKGSTDKGNNRQEELSQQWRLLTERINSLDEQLYVARRQDPLRRALSLPISIARKIALKYYEWKISRLG